MKKRERRAATALLRQFLLAALVDIEAARVAIQRHRPDGLVGEAVSVRKLRIALRRVQYEIEALAPYDSSRIGRTLAKRLHKIGGPLGELRDSEILQERIKRALNDQTASTAGELLLSRVSEVREVAQVSANVVFNSRKLRDVLVAVRQYADALPETDVTPQLLRPVVRRVVVSTWKDLRHAANRARKKPSDGRRHALRIATKRMVYCLQAISPAADVPAGDLIKKLTVLQRRLGQQHDRVVVATWLSRERHAPPKTARLMKSLTREQRRRSKKEDESWREDWKSVRKQRRRETWF